MLSLKNSNTILDIIKIQRYKIIYNALIVSESALNKTVKYSFLKGIFRIKCKGKVTLLPLF